MGVEFLDDYTIRVVALGAATLGIVAGALGAFAVLRGQSLLGDAVSHASLPGIVVAFLLTGTKAPLALLVGAALAGWAATLVVMAIVRTTRVKYDAALGLVLSVFFGIGLVLLTDVQKRPDATQAGLDRFLFGQAAALLREDVITMALLGAPVLGLLVLGWKEFKLLAFDPGFAASAGFPVRALDIALTSLLVVAIVVGLQTVGVVLMSAIVVAPAAAARQWTDRLGTMVVLSATFGAGSGVAGALLSSRVERLPTGPTIVLCATVLVTASLLAAPRRGLVWRAIAERRGRRRLRVQAVLRDLYALAEHDPRAHGHARAVLDVMQAGTAQTGPTLAELERRGLATRVGDDEWMLTPAGRSEAERQRGDGR
ncbi:MAG: metal ABC transporter permease [Thermoleophilia bacterium]|nr:metal ABC transporter permease [Thermoleophilia bacterium]